MLFKRYFYFKRMNYFNITRFIVTFQSNSHKIYGLILVLRSLLQILDKIQQMSLRPCVRTKVVLDESAQSRVYTVYTLHVNPNGTHCQQMCMSLVGHVLQLFVSPLSDHRHSTAAVKYPSSLKVMEAGSASFPQLGGVDWAFFG